MPAPARSPGPTLARPAGLGAADWLCLAAAPTFAAMALLTAAHGAGRMAMLCAPAPTAWPLAGMVPMYVLMSAFHAAPWLRLLSGRRAVAARSDGRGWRWPMPRLATPVPRRRGSAS